MSGSSGNNIKTRKFRDNYVLPLTEATDVIEDEYRAGRVKAPYGTNRREFPYRSIIRGDFETKHFGTVTWQALDEFKIFFLGTVLSSNRNVKLPYDLWQSALDRYIQTQLAILQSEKQRYTSDYEYHLAGDYVNHNFFEGQTSPTIYSTVHNANTGASHSYDYQILQLEDVTKISSENGRSYTYKQSSSIPVGSYSSGPAGSSVHFKLGYVDEFRSWMPEYHAGNHSQGFESVSSSTGPDTPPVFNYNNYGGTTYSDQGMLEDMELFFNNLKDLKYDYSNLDDCLAKNFFYFKLEDPRIPLDVEAPDTVNNYKWPYVNEVYLYEKDIDPKSILADQWTNWPVCKDPNDEDSISNPDIAGRDWWLTIEDHQGFANEKDEWSNSQEAHAAAGTDWGLLKQRRPIQYSYTFGDKQLFYSPSLDPLVHDERDPRIIDGVEYRFSTENGQPNESLADESGLRFFILGAKTNHIYQYSLSENYDLVPIVKYDLLKYPLPPSDKSSTEAWWRSNGTRYWVIGIHSDTIHQYDTSIPWNVGSRYTDISFDVTPQDRLPQGITWRPNGMRMFVCGWQHSKLYQYDMKEKPWTLEKINNDSEFNAEFAGEFDVKLQDIKPVQMLFNNTGDKLYMLGQDTATLYEYVCDEPYDITTASYNEVSFSVHLQEQNPESFYIGQMGTKLFITGENSIVYEYNMSSYNISTAVYHTELNIGIHDGTPTGITFDAAGTRMYIVGSESDQFYEYEIIGQTWTVDNIPLEPITEHPILRGFRDLSDQEGGPQGLYFRPDGFRMFTVGNSIDAIQQWDLPAGDLSIVIPAGSLDVSGDEISPTGLHFKKNGKEVFIVGPQNDKVVWYLLQNAWDIRTKIAKLGEYDLRQPNLTNIYPTDLRFSDDGTKMYVSDLNTNSLHQFELERPWEPPSAVRIKFKELPEDVQPQGFWFSPDGLNLFVVGTVRDLVLQYSLVTAWDIDTLEFTLKTYSVRLQDGSPRAIVFSNPPNLFSMVPVRAKFEGVEEVRNNSKILKIDSNVFETEDSVDDARNKYLPRILDRRMTYYDDNAKSTPITNEILDDYKINIVREKNGQ